MKKTTFLIVLSAVAAVSNAQKVGIATITPKADFNVADGKNVLFGSNVSGFGTKILWQPTRAAFRAGGVSGNDWDIDSMGGYSFASGVDTKAIGNYSTAMGAQSVASGLTAVAIGAANIASGGNSVAIGAGSTASQDFAVAIGRFATATNYSSVSIGEKNLASGAFAVAMGIVTRAAGESSLTVGNNTVSKARGSFASGTFNDTLDNPNGGVSAANDRIFQLGNGAETSRSNALTVLRNGNMGIGTATPLAPLHIKSNNINPVIIDGGNQLFVTLAENGNNVGYIGSFAGNANDVELGTYGGNTTGSVILSTNNSPKLTVNNNGNVGIGTSTATTAKLVISGTTGQEGIDLATTDQYANLRVIRNSLHGADKDMYIGFQSGPVSSLHLYSNNNETVTIKGNNVGVGNAAPASKLEVNGALATKINYYGSGSGTVTIDNSAAVYMFTVTGYSAVLPDPAACANRRYTLVNKSGFSMGCSNFYNMSNNVSSSIPANSSIEVIASINTNRWEQVR